MFLGFLWISRFLFLDLHSRHYDSISGTSKMVNFLVATWGPLWPYVVLLVQASLPNGDIVQSQLYRSI